MKVRTFVVFGLAALSGAALLHVSQRVQQAEDKLAHINAEIRKEEEATKLLSAEWEYLNRPERLERLANEFLEMAPPSPDAVSHSVAGPDAYLPEKEGVAIEGAEYPQTQPVVFGGEEKDEPALDIKPPVKPEILKAKPKSDKSLNKLLNELNAAGGE